MGATTVGETYLLQCRCAQTCLVIFFGSQISAKFACGGYVFRATCIHSTIAIQFTTFCRKGHPCSSNAGQLLKIIAYAVSVRIRSNHRLIFFPRVFACFFSKGMLNWTFVFSFMAESPLLGFIEGVGSIDNSRLVKNRNPMISTSPSL